MTNMNAGAVPTRCVWEPSIVPHHGRACALNPVMLPRPLGYSQIGVGHRAIGEEDASPSWLRSFAGPRLCDVVLLMRLLRRQAAAGNGLLTE